MNSNDKTKAQPVDLPHCLVENQKMALFDWIFNRAPTISDPAPDPTDRAKWLDSPLPKWEPPPRAAQQPAEPRQMTDQTVAKAVQLGDIHIAIDYADATGNQSSRNITAQAISFGTHGPILNAICHTRHAVRHFRIDRIKNVITSDGEVFTAKRFFRDVLQIDLKQVGASAQSDSLESARKLRDFLRPALSILVLAAKTDDEFHPAELAEIMGYVSREAVHLHEIEKFSRPIDLKEMQHLETMIRTLRPLDKSVAGYLRSILSQRPERILRLCDAVRAVVRADGIVNLAEEIFLEDLDTLRIQVEIGEAAKLKRLVEDADWSGFDTVNRRRMFVADAREDE